MKELDPTQVIEFLRENNAIERVYDEPSLNRAIYAWKWLIQREKLTMQAILRVHSLLAPNDLPPEWIGKFRRCPIYIGNHEGLAWNKILEALKEWLKFMNANAVNPTPDQAEQWAKDWHVKYEKIHPFVDGNGRTGRMFMNWHRVKKLGLPLLVIHEGNEQLAYYKWFTT